CSRSSLVALYIRPSRRADDEFVPGRLALLSAASRQDGITPWFVGFGRIGAYRIARLRGWPGPAGALSRLALGSDSRLSGKAIPAARPPANDSRIPPRYQGFIPSQFWASGIAQRF